MKLKNALILVAIMMLAGFAYAQDKPAPPQELVDEVIELFMEKGEPLNPNLHEDAERYKKILGLKMDSIAVDITEQSVSHLSQELRRTLSDAFNDYAIALSHSSYDPTEEDMKKAEEMYLISVMLDDKDPVNLKNFGMFYFLQEDFGNAKKYLKMSYDLNPNEEGLYSLIEFCEKQLGE